ncbi:TetR family transcriptional regulator [Rhodococcus sp. WB1]|uniref:TetR/AcrR family transcriptional regulator n=1 Tax=Rhodococcus TaxID=1827 RepID=UPI000622C9B4|nr:MULTISPECIES: TetR/AcrR family transcriptional regulator [Rhodococcus]AKE88807.1 TetR family transcriptional regulator [Rhodococcus aetherivorans]ANZ26509.1 TetR family transcriptional regulator [Rhodococcus sp. WB1]UGQ40299.1 TetR/AcrR family transcriptional regulator [Rhodococcus aetherivorans]USC16494.1 TetR/AcrR family transcriptional regulator [Rhodococcus sp. 11-3]
MARRRANVLSENAEVARGQILKAAESMFQRYGLTKTTMDDIAKEAGVSRPTVYRYFGDRDTLITALIELRSRRLFDKARAFLRERTTFAEQIVDGLIFLVDRGRHDPIVRLIVSPEHMDMATALIGSTGLAVRLTQEMWAPLLDEARERGEIREGLTDEEICQWIALVQLILVGRMDFGSEGDPENRRMLTNFLLPGIVTEEAAEQLRSGGAAATPTH